MKIHSVVALVGLAISFALPTYAQQKDTVDPELRHALGKKMNDALDKNDAAAVAACFTEDAIFVTNTGPVNGREVIKKCFGTRCGGIRLQSCRRIVNLEAVGLVFSFLITSVE